MSANLLFCCRIRFRCSSHFNIVAAKKEEKGVTGETQNVKENYELNSSWWTKLESFKKVTTQKDADTCSRNCNATSEHASLKMKTVMLAIYIRLILLTIVFNIISLKLTTFDMELTLTMLLLRLNCVSRYFGRKTMKPDTMMSSVQAPWKSK